MTFLSLSPLRNDATVHLFSQGRINAFAAPAQQSLFISEGMRLKGLLSLGDGSHRSARCKCMKKGSAWRVCWWQKYQAA